MDIQPAVDFVNSLAVKFPWMAWVLLVLSILGSLVVVASAVVLATPSKADDAILEKVESNSIGGFFYKFLVAFSPLKKK